MPESPLSAKADEEALMALRAIVTEFPHLRECDFNWLLDRIQSEKRARYGSERKGGFPFEREVRT